MSLITTPVAPGSRRFRRSTTGRPASSTDTGPSGARRSGWASPWSPRTLTSSRCPTPARSSGTFAHTSWFFETFVLSAALPDYQTQFPQYNFLFNSYYNTIGERIARDRRGLLSRPSIKDVLRYRAEIDTRMESWLGSAELSSIEALKEVIVLGFHHEQQHQELIVTDLKHAFAANPSEASLSGEGPRNRGSGPNQSAGRITPGAFMRSAMTARASRSITSRQGTRSISSASSWRADPPRTRSTWNSWRMRRL